MSNSLHDNKIQKLSLFGIIITMGIVYGDIGTSPLYVMKAIIAWGQDTSRDYILGALSAIIWTLTLQTTIKYVIITLRADNKGEGGILALYALQRRLKRKWLYFIAIIGASALIADGMITPSITVVSAIEGLDMILPGTPVVPIVIMILTLLFVFQQFGTQNIGKFFGPVMMLWFLMLGVLGVGQILKYPQILEAFNPWLGIKLVFTSPSGFLIMGAVFLSTTGAEALYSDLGHCGIRNIRASWVFVKTGLVLNYLGQGAWILSGHQSAKDIINPFFGIMPESMLVFGVLMATMAAIIASQALISGSYTIFSEAMSLNLWPRLKIKYPTVVKGQLYIPFVNWFLYFACVFVVIYFKDSSKMEAAYGLSITITMLMTTILMLSYLLMKKVNIALIFVFAITYLSIEGSFLISNMFKFMHGGWLTVLLAGLIGWVMYVWYNARKIKNKQLKFVKVKDYFNVIKDLSEDTSVPKYATNLVFLSKADYLTDLENKIIYSLLHKHPKRADHYWILHVHYIDEPYSLKYSVEELIPNVLCRVEFRLGFRVQPLINQYFRQVIEDLVAEGKFDSLSGYPSLRKANMQADFRFIVIHRVHNYEAEFTWLQKLIMNMYGVIAKFGLSDIRALNLDTSNVKEETVPLVINYPKRSKIERIV